MAEPTEREWLEGLRYEDKFGEMLDGEFLDEVVSLFHAEYARNFPRGGDAQDHDEAIRAAVEAVVVLCHQSKEPE